jgi:fructoselysine-6-P-deglycase FrlB-like protein
MNEKPSALEMRLGASFLKTVDEWRRKQKGLPSRAEAIRRLVERGPLRLVFLGTGSSRARSR